MNRIIKHVAQNSDLIAETIKAGAVLGLTTITIISIVKRRKTEATLGAASFVIQDLGGDPIPLVIAKLKEYSMK